jgi:hypothetical protein
MTAGDMPHKREMPVVDRADFTGLLERTQPIDRKNDVDIFVGIGMIIIVVRDDKISCRRITGDFSKRRIAGRVLHVKSGLRS